MKRIIITGATSMIGTALTEVAVLKDTEVYAIIRPNTKRTERIISSPKVHIVYGDLANLNKIDSIPYGCDTFYHFAWLGTSKSERDDPIIQQKNIEYAMDAVLMSKRLGCRRFVGAGSQAEYGPVDGVIDESTNFKPVISYGIAKYAASILTKKLCESYGIEHVWGRVFSVYGPHDNKDTMIDYAINRFLSGETAEFSSGEQYWNYLYETDAGKMFYILGLDTTPTGEWMIANSQSRPLKEYIRIMADVYGENARISLTPINTSMPCGINVNLGNTLKRLGFTPEVSFKSGIKKVIDYKKGLN